MASKTLGILLAIFVCIILFPIGIGLLGGLFGLMMGLIGGAFGIIAGVFGALFGAIASLIGWMFDLVFGGDHHFHFGTNFGIIVLIIVAVILISQNKRK